jgi:predicted dithiol-disulfide oxidoreductase (DUF899 family)
MNAKVEALEMKIYEMKQTLSKERQKAKPQKVKDYEFQTAKGKTKLSKLFGKNEDLIVIHNMGKSCNYCTMWADVLQSQLRHLERRASVVLISPDTPATQQAHAKKRGWKMRMASDRGGDFTPDMGFKKDDGYWPGVSAFHKNEDGTIVRTGKSFFGPGDDFCPPWHFFDLLQGGVKGWEPR